ncbi:MAG: sporulation protein YqfC [Firmicutes bacterium]|nr:sporulation protein YqfC [Bacillota bacterium]
MMRRSLGGIRLAQFLELPPEALVEVSRIEVIGRLQFRVENHRGVDVYDASQVVLRLADGLLRIEGENLVIGWIDHQELVVTGRICSFRFEEGRL